MGIYIEQNFLMGRFHATRWRENPFADPHGEWPPSPWRLLRSLAARWFQYSRETGDTDSSAIEALLRTLASRRPEFRLPTQYFRGPALRQYQPTEFAWSDPAAGSGAVKKSKTTLFPDPYFVINPQEPLIWMWPELNPPGRELLLLQDLLPRITYFGRAESLSRLRVVDSAPPPNCLPAEHDGDAPVLCFDTKTELRLDSLLVQSSDQEPVADVPIPPGTEWVFYKRPKSPPLSLPTKTPVQRQQPFIQFSLGGHVYPPEPLWIKVIERFRGRVLKMSRVNANPTALELLSGKQADGTPLSGEHRHAYFLLWPDSDGNPARLIVWRKPESPFAADELAALMDAATLPIRWAPHGDWTIQMLPLPFAMNLPQEMSGPSTVWESATPFVRPTNRHLVRPNGRKRPSEEPEEICAKLIETVWRVRPKSVERIDDATPWMKLHESERARRLRRTQGNRTPRVGPGYHLRVHFDHPFQGPLIVGDSAHFGLGVFRAIKK